VRLNRIFHEAHLVKTGFEEELRELRKSFLAEVASAVEIVTPGEVAFGKAVPVRFDVAGKAAGDTFVAGTIRSVGSQSVTSRASLTASASGWVMRRGRAISGCTSTTARMIVTPA
jgi:hypothetical protein